MQKVSAGGLLTRTACVLYVRELLHPVKCDLFIPGPCDIQESI